MRLGTMGLRIRGTIVVHELNITVAFHTEAETVILDANLVVSDHELYLAALIIAKELQQTVIWQDIVGRKHFAYHDSAVEAYDSDFDPRYTTRPANMRVQ